MNQGNCVSYVTLLYGKITFDTELALEFLFGNVKAWIPRKLIRNLDEHAHTVEVPDWVVNDRGLAEYILKNPPTRKPIPGRITYPQVEEMVRLIQETWNQPSPPARDYYTTLSWYQTKDVQKAFFPMLDNYAVTGPPSPAQIKKAVDKLSQPGWTDGI